jgi:hypothetical protein
MLRTTAGVVIGLSNRQGRIPPFAGISKTGATGLEPATSGVTGQYSKRYMGDDRFMMALITSVLGRERACPRWLHRFVAHVCCPIAARRRPFLSSFLSDKDEP